MNTTKNKIRNGNPQVQPRAQRHTSKRRAAHLLIAFLSMASSGFALSSQIATATSASCTATKEVRRFPALPDRNRAWATCSSIGSDTKVRARLDVTAGGDPVSSWFTTRNTTHYTTNPYDVTCPFGCSARYDVAGR